MKGSLVARRSTGIGVHVDVSTCIGIKMLPSAKFFYVCDY